MSVCLYANLSNPTQGGMELTPQHILKLYLGPVGSTRLGAQYDICDCLVTSPLEEVQIIVMSMPVCLYVCLPTHITGKLHCHSLPIFVHIACGRGSVLL